MDHCFQAIFEHGMLRPLEPLELQESEVVSLLIQKPQALPDAMPAVDGMLGQKQRDMVLAFVSRMETLPPNSPQDGLSNRDHDRLIYGS
jgi:predicted DNA-binding antitoxin AbrB/MazE fold protein